MVSNTETSAVLLQLRFLYFCTFSALLGLFRTFCWLESERRLIKFADLRLGYKKPLNSHPSFDSL